MKLTKQEPPIATVMDINENFNKKQSNALRCESKFEKENGNIIKWYAVLFKLFANTSAINNLTCF